MRFGDIINFVRRDDVKGYLEKSWTVGWPMVLIMLFNFLINLTDVYIAGRIGKEVQAAYGVVSQLYFIFIVVATALNVGSVSVISKLFTAGDRKVYEKSVASSIVAASAAGLTLSVIGVAAAGYLVRAMNIPASVKEYAVPLITIYAAGILFHYLLINFNGILRSSKRIKASMWTMLLVCSLNVILNFALVFGTPLGFRGIAVATVVSVIVGALVNSFYVRDFTGKLFSCSLSFIKRMFSVGWPIGVLQFIWMLGSAVLYLVLSMVPQNQVEILAAFTNGMRVESAIFLPAFAFNFANAVVLGNLMGAGRYEDAFRNGLITTAIGICVVSALTAIIVLNAQWVMPLLSNNAIVVAESRMYLYFVMISEPFMAASIILAGGLEGAGDTRSVLLRVGASIWLVRIPLAFICVVVLGWGARSVWLVMVVSMMIQAALVAQRYMSKKWLYLQAIGQRSI
jgi:putative MATE family efflux protein